MAFQIERGLWSIPWVLNNVPTFKACTRAALSRFRRARTAKYPLEGKMSTLARAGSRETTEDGNGDRKEEQQYLSTGRTSGLPGFPAWSFEWRLRQAYHEPTRVFLGQLGEFTTPGWRSIRRPDSCFSKDGNKDFSKASWAAECSSVTGTDSGCR